MKCNFKNNRIVPKKVIPEVIDLNECLYHGIGTYLEPQEKLNRVRAILDSNAILSEDLQSSDLLFIINTLVLQSVMVKTIYQFVKSQALYIRQKQAKVIIALFLVV